MHRLGNENWLLTAPVWMIYGRIMTDDRVPQRRHLVTEIPGPASRELVARRERAVARGVSSVLPVYVSEADGGVLVDVDGNSLIDLGAGIAVVSVGHAAPRGGRARSPSRPPGSPTPASWSTPTRATWRCARSSPRRTPGDHAKRTALFNSGAEAVENAVKIARHATGRQAVVVFDHAYHGRTNLTMALTAKNMPYKDRFGPFAPEVYRVPMSYPFRDPAGMSGAEAAARAIELIERSVGGGQRGLRAHRADPGRGRVRGAGARLPPGPGRLVPGPRCGLLADEIQTGFCRTGDWFACEDEGVVPDLVTTAKALAGGMPLAAVTGRAELMDAVHVGGLGGTYGGNPVACAAAPGRHRHHANARPGRRGPSHRRDHLHPFAVAARTATRPSAMSGAAAP